MKKPIRFSTHQNQKHREAYWLSRSPEERLAELVRLRQKAYWQYFSQPKELEQTTRIRVYSINETESLKQFYTRIEQERKRSNF